MFLANNRNTDSDQLLDSQRRGKSMSYNKTNVHRHPNNRYHKHFDSQTQNESRDQQQKRLNYHSMKVPAFKYRLPWIKQQQTTLQTNRVQDKKIQFNRQYRYKPKQKMQYNSNFTNNYNNNIIQDKIYINHTNNNMNKDDSSQSQEQSQYTQNQQKQIYQHTQQHKQHKYTKPWMIIQHNQDQQQNYEVFDHKNLQNTYKINQQIPQINMKNNDPQNLWKSKVNKKQEYIILNYLNGFVDKKRKRKSKKKSMSLNQININQNNQNNLSHSIGYINLNGKSNHKIQPLRPYRQSVKTQMKKHVTKNQIMKEHLQPTFIKAKNVKKTCPGNQNKHKRQLSTILLKQQMTLQKQQKLIEQLKHKVQQFQLSKNYHGIEKNTKKINIRKSPKKQNNNSIPGRYQYENVQLQKQSQKNNIKQTPNLYKKQFQSLQKSLNINNKNEQKQLIISHRTKEQTDNKTTLTVGCHPKIQQTGVNTYNKLKTLTSSNSLCNSQIKKSTITSQINEFGQNKQKTNQKSSNISLMNGSLRSTSKSFKVQKRSKVRTNFPLRIPNLDFLKIQTFYAVLVRKNQNENGSNKILFQSSLTTSPINRSPSKRPLIKQKFFQRDYLNNQLPKDQQQLKDFIDSFIPLNPTLNFKQLFKKPTFQIILDPQKHLYFGELTQKQSRHGYGVYLQKKYIYEGYWQNNMKIYGIQINQSGYYKGDFKNNKKQGKGQFKWINKQYYNGEWKNGKKHGNGMWSSPNGDHYVGEWVEGKVQGQGIHTSYNGQQYQGQFKKFLKSGWGKQHLPNGDSYQGDFIDGKPHGKGIYRWANGQMYDGQFINGFRQYYGTFKDTYSNKYQGQFNNQQATGLCQINFGNGDHFEGNISNGMFNGNGKLTLFQEKQQWNGSWLNNEYIENL